MTIICKAVHDSDEFIVTEISGSFETSQLANDELIFSEVFDSKRKAVACYLARIAGWEACWVEDEEMDPGVLISDSWHYLEANAGVPAS